MSDSLLHPDAEISTPIIATHATERPRRGFFRRVLRPLIVVLTAQYTIVLLVSLSVVGTVRTLILPQILTSFETIATALKRAPF